MPANSTIVRSSMPADSSTAVDPHRRAALHSGDLSTHNLHLIEPREELAPEIVRSAYFEGDFLFRSGARSRYFFDKYLFETDPRLLGSIAKAMAALLPSDLDLLAGQELEGVPLAAAISLETGAPYVIHKKQAKSYGTRKIIDGRPVDGLRCVIVEDVLTSGGQAITGAKTAAEAGGTVSNIVAIVDREEGARAKLGAAGYELTTLFTRSELDRFLKRD